MPDDEATAFSASDAFEIGYAWALHTRVARICDGRDVIRLFGIEALRGLALNDAAVDPLSDRDTALVAAKAEILRVIAEKAVTS